MADNILKSLKDLEDPEVLREFLATGKDKIQEFPLVAVGIAAGLGFMVGVLGTNKVIKTLQERVRPSLGDFDPMGLVMNTLHSGLSGVAKTATAGRERPLTTN
jgi:hypothetical protein